MQLTTVKVTFLIKYTTKPKKCTTVILCLFINFVANFKQSLLRLLTNWTTL